MMAAVHLFSLAVLLIPLFSSTRAAQITAGPLAPASIYSLIEYSTARPCAADCLWDNGDVPCGAGRFYNDIAIALGCGCGAINACYCSTGLASSATSIIQSCVSAQCDGIADVGVDASSMLGLYDGYCATANVELSTSTLASMEETKTTSAGRLAETTSTAAAETSATAPTAIETADSSNPTSTSSPTSEPKEDEGLSKSDIIALATGLGVGVPSLVIAVVALVIQSKKRSSRNRLDSGLSTPLGSQTHVLHTLTPLQAQTPSHANVHMQYQGPYQGSFQSLAPERPQVYELGGLGTGRWQ